MEIEKIFRNIPDFYEIELDIILFESKYPVMFTCKNNKDIYLFICCLVNNREVKWIGTQTTYENLIELLENKITIRDAFLNISDNKIMIGYDGRNVEYTIEKKDDIPEALLPTAGEYMEAEEGEYAEEIAVFKRRNSTVEYVIKQRKNIFWTFRPIGSSFILTDSYLDKDTGTFDETKYSLGRISECRMMSIGR